MVQSLRSDFRIIPEVVAMGINLLDLMRECIELGNWGEVLEYFGGIYSKQDFLFTLGGCARRYLDLGEYNYYVALMLTLKQMLVRFGEVNKA